MPVLAIVAMEGEPDALLEGYMGLGLEEVIRDQPGRLMHACARTAGGLLMVGVWAERSHLDALAGDARVREWWSTASREPTVEVHEVDRLLLGPRLLFSGEEPPAL